MTLSVDNQLLLDRIQAKTLLNGDLWDVPLRDWPLVAHWIWSGASTGREGYIQKKMRGRDGVLFTYTHYNNPMPLIREPGGKRILYVHKVLYEAFIEPLKEGETLKKIDDECQRNLCICPYHWKVAKRKAYGGYEPFIEDDIPLKPRDDVDDLVDLIEQECAVDEPTSLQELLERTAMIDWSLAEIQEALGRIGGPLQEKLN
jgi:hypothetical protein